MTHDSRPPASDAARVLELARRPLIPADAGELTARYVTRPADDAAHVLSEWFAYRAIAGVCGPGAAEDETGASLPEHAARLAAALGDLLAAHASLSVIAAGVIR